jgi:hypothetical protein
VARLDHETSPVLLVIEALMALRGISLLAANGGRGTR